MASLFGASTAVAGWGPNGFYPTSVRQQLPSPQQAQELLVESGGILSALRNAHWQSLRWGWGSISQQPGPRLESDLSGSRSPAQGLSLQQPASSQRCDEC
ncbi:hypothetical protein [Halochromatium sp.]